MGTKGKRTVGKLICHQEGEERYRVREMVDKYYGSIDDFPEDVNFELHCNNV